MKEPSVVEEKIEKQPNNPFSSVVPQLTDFKKDGSLFSVIEEKTEANNVANKFEKKSRRNKGKRGGVQYVVSSTPRLSEPQSHGEDEDEPQNQEVFQRAAESERSSFREDTQAYDSRASFKESEGSKEED